MFQVLIRVAAAILAACVVALLPPDARADSSVGALVSQAEAAAQDSIARQEALYLGYLQLDADAVSQLQLLDTRLALMAINADLHPQGGGGQEHAFLKDAAGQVAGLNPRLLTGLGGTLLRQGLSLDLSDPALRPYLEKVAAAVAVASLAEAVATNRISMGQTERVVSAGGDRGFSLSFDERLSHLGAKFDPNLNAGTTLRYGFSKDHWLDLHLDARNLTRALKPVYEGALGAQLGADHHLGLAESLSDNRPDAAHHLLDSTTVASINRLAATIHYRELTAAGSRVTDESAAVSDSWALEGGAAQLSASVTGSRHLDSTQPKATCEDHLAAGVGIGGTVDGRFVIGGNANAGMAPSCQAASAGVGFQITDMMTQLNGVLHASYDQKTHKEALELTLAGQLDPPDRCGAEVDSLMERVNFRLSDLASLEDELGGLEGTRLLGEPHSDTLRLRSLIAEARADLRRNLAELSPLERPACAANVRSILKGVAVRLAGRIADLSARVDDQDKRLREQADPASSELRGPLGQSRLALAATLKDLAALGPEAVGVDAALLENARDQAAGETFGMRLQNNPATPR